MEFNLIKMSQIVMILLLLRYSTTLGQVCSTIGGLCQKSTDCCRGCCEANTCVDRPYSCSPDLVATPGRNSCEKYFCAAGELCFLAEICPPENPCPEQPFCRKASGSGYNGTVYLRRNSAGHLQLQPILTISLFLLAGIFNV